MKHVISAAALAAVIMSAASVASAEEAKTEKCYGVVKTGKNDCGTSKHGCAGAATVDGDAEEWINVPAGLCAKLVKGSTEAPKVEEKKE
ncbi:MAG: DUF2282 domain-containing protein [Alphaproteobacteria bacterium]